MKPLVIILSFLFSFTENTKDTNYFKLITTQKSGQIFRTEKQVIKINNTTVSSYNTHFIKTNYPKFDTIKLYNNDTLKKAIITRFTPDSTYYLAHAFSGDFDFFDTKKWNLWNRYINHTDNKVTRDDLYQGAQVCFKITNAPIKDTILGYYGDFNGDGPKMKRLFLNTTSTFITPEKGYYVNNFNYILIGKYIEKNTPYIEYNTFDFSGDYAPLKVYSKMNCRFFCNEKILVTYDFRTSKTSMKIIEN